MDKLQNNIIDIAHNHYKYIMSLQNINGIGFGYKRINGINTFEPCIHVLVESKIRKEYLTQNNLIPKYYMGIKTDVIKVGKIRQTSENVITEKFRPLKSGAGISISYSDKAGTLGCVVFKKKLLSKEYFILSNNHVIADLNKAPIGSYIIQPNKTNNGDSPKDVIAFLSTFEKIKFIEDESNIEEAPINYVDCAIAKITKKSFVSNKIIGLDEIKGVSKPELELHVKKVGIATGMTEGKIITIGTTIAFRFYNGKGAIFQDTIVADLKGESGDSGSILLNDNNEIVGLVFAGSEILEYSYINNIERVLSSLGVKLYTG